MRLPRLSRMIRWSVFASSLAGVDFAAIHWVITARTDTIGGIGGGGWKHYDMYDGSGVNVVVLNSSRGKMISRTVTRPAPFLGLCKVWWPAVAGVFLTPLVLAVARTRTGRWVIAEMPLPCMTTRRWMITVAVLGIEGGLVISTLRTSGRDPMREQWLPLLAQLFVLHAVAFLPAGSLLIYNYIRDKRAKKGDVLGTDRV
jgi:hypothetical protein